jgi:hypothetical protein
MNIASAPQTLPRELTVGQVAARSGRAVSAIRFYEADGRHDFDFEVGTRKKRMMPVLSGPER